MSKAGPVISNVYQRGLPMVVCGTLDINFYVHVFEVKINFSVFSVHFFFAGGADVFSKRFLEDILQYSVIVNIWEVLKYLLSVNIVNAQNKTFSPPLLSETAHLVIVNFLPFFLFFFLAKAKTIIIVTFSIIYFVDQCIYFVNVSWCC